MEREPLVIVGGGASGLFLASLIPSALLIEKNPVLGRKLLVSGGGQCNVTHDEDTRSFTTRFYEKRGFVSPALYALGPDGVRSYFASLGVETFSREDGKVFPVSLRSSDVRDALSKKLEKVLLDTEAREIERTEDGFVVDLGEKKLLAENLVIATGGTVCPQSGSTGDGLRWAKALGHRIVPTCNALSGIRLEEDVSSLEGIALEEAVVKVGKIEATGPLLFTRKGISGPTVQNLSRYCSGRTDITLRLCQITAEEIKVQNGKAKASNAIHLMTGLPSRLVENLLKLGDKNIASLTKEDLRNIVTKLSDWRAVGTTRGEEKNAMVTRGGVDTREVDSRTFQSKLHEGLYFLGEALDVDGECGGYNLTFAFSSAYAASLDLRKKLGL